MKGINGFPDDFAHPKKKESTTWGIKIPKAIWGIADNTSHGSFKWRNERFFLNEKLAQGLQGSDQYKPKVGEEGGTESFLHMFWKETSPLPKYIRTVTNVLTEREYEPVCTSLDKASKTERAKEFAKLKANMFLKKQEEKLFRGTGIKLVPDNARVPKSNEELEIILDNYKTSLEIAQELGVKCVFQNNNIKRVKKKFAKELAVKQWAAVETRYNSHGDIEINAIKPEYLITPYSEDDYFEKRKWTAHIKKMTISEIRLYNANGTPVYNDQELFEMAERNAHINENGGWKHSFDIYNHDQLWNSFTVDVLCYEYNTVNRHSWVAKRKENMVIVRKTKPFSKPKSSDKKELIQKDRQVWYDGMWVVGSDKLLQHKLRENMAFNNKEGLYDGEPYSRYIIVAPEIINMINKAIPEAAEVYIHNMHSALLKLQQLLTEMRPPTVQVSLKSLQGVVEGLGLRDGKPMDIIKIQKQIGILFTSGLEPGQAAYDITPRYQGLMNEVITAYNKNLEALESELGINDVLVGQSRNQYEGLGSRQMKATASIKALSHLQDAIDHTFDKVAEVVSVMVQDTLSRGDKIKGFEAAIGKVNVDMIRLQRELTLAEVGIKMELLPTEEEIERLDFNIERCLNNDSIRLEDAEQVRQLAKSNYKNALRYMAFKRKEYLEERMMEAQNAAMANSQQQQQSAQMAAALEAREKQLEHERKLQILEMESLFKEKQNKEEHFDDMDEIRLQGQEKLKQIAAANAHSLNDTTMGNSALAQPRVYTGEG